MNPAFLLRVLVAALLLSALSGCGPPKPALIRIGVAANHDVNPDAKGRARPVVVRVYELKSISVFNSADFFSLQDKETETLAADVVSREELQLRPGDTRVLEKPAKPDAKYVAAIAAFRDLERARWRSAAPLPAKPKGSVPVSITLTGKTVSVAVATEAETKSAKP